MMEDATVQSNAYSAAYCGSLLKTSQGVYWDPFSAKEAAALMLNLRWPSADLVLGFRVVLGLIVH